MPWLVVLGEGDWLPERGVRFGPGKHEVDQARADQAKRSGIRRLLVLDVEPEIVNYDDTTGPLTPDHIQRGAPRGVFLKPDAITRDDLVPMDDAPPLEHFCLYCDHPGFRSKAALDRHVEFHHPDA